MRIDVEQIKAMQMLRAEINSKPLEEIELFENGKPIEIDPQVLEEWKFVGLSNIAFIEDEVYLAKDTIYKIF